MVCSELAFETILAPVLTAPNIWEIEERAKAAVAAARELPPAEQAALAVYAAGRVVREEGLQMIMQPFLSALLRKKLPFGPEQAAQLVEAVTAWHFAGPLLPVLSVAEAQPLTPELRAALSRLRAHRWLQSGYSDVLKPLAKLDELLVTAQPEAPVRRGPWTRQLLDSVSGEGGEIPLRKLLGLGAGITGAKPPRKWLAEANQLVDLFGREAFRRRAIDWLALGPSTAKPPEPVESGEADEQRALLWALTGFSDAETCSAVAAFTERCLKKIPSIGPVCQKGGNAGVSVLAAMGGDDALAQLSRLASRIRYATAQRLISKALEEAAAASGLTWDELEERTVPDCGLDAEGRWSRRVGGYTLELDVEDPTLRILNAEGKLLKSPPAALKAEHGDELKRAKAQAAEVAAMLAAHRLRIERLLLTGRRIPLALWRRCYLDHPLLRDLSRRLIWRFAWAGQEQAAMWVNGRLEDWNGAAVDPAEDAQVQLWSPLHADVQTVLAWRCRLEDSGLRQPFKQAHREVYLLTDAERATANHSNRFAAHILAQHQFAALAKARGWRFSLMGMWDSHNTPTLELPEAGLEAQLHVDFASNEAVSGHMVYLYITTDRVTLHRSGEPLPVALESIPAAVFSEVMRDVDLFVGVTSVASDPAWTPGRWLHIDEYRERTTQEELTASAESRRDLLSRLLPRLPIADRARLEDRFLVVRGERATYKIHLGSANVIMEPGGRYLCIVQGGETKVMLPFEGDHTLSLVLSKAFLLANDAKIKDRSILSQMRG